LVYIIGKQVKTRALNHGFFYLKNTYIYTMETTKLFDAIRTMYHNGLVQNQVDSINAILAGAAKHGITDVRQISYMLATAYHEAGFLPLEEIGKGKGLAYGSKLDMGAGPGHRVPYDTPDVIYYGRGLVQLTWKCNYAQFGKMLGIDLVNHPELALNTTYAAEILVVGMQKGMFTGRKLADYFNSTNPPDALNARKIINGLDKAELISGYYQIILKSLT
jgi:predicted chitinase